MQLADENDGVGPGCTPTKALASPTKRKALSSMGNKIMAAPTQGQGKQGSLSPTKKHKVESLVERIMREKATKSAEPAEDVRTPTKPKGRGAASSPLCPMLSPLKVHRGDGATPGAGQGGTEEVAYTVRSRGVQNVEDGQKFKVLVVGNSKCGKSSIISRYCKGTFNTDYSVTVGADYAQKELAVAADKDIRLQLWDIAGQDRFASLTRVYYNHADAAVVVCDVTRMQTLEAARTWKQELDDKLMTVDGKSIPVVLLANKCDLLEGGVEAVRVGLKIQSMATQMGFKGCVITSAKEDSNLVEGMWYLVESVLDTYETKKAPEKRQDFKQGFKLDGKSVQGRPKQGNCC